MSHSVQPKLVTAVVTFLLFASASSSADEILYEGGFGRSGGQIVDFEALQFIGRMCFDRFLCREYGAQTIYDFIVDEADVGNEISIEGDAFDFVANWFTDGELARFHQSMSLIVGGDTRGGAGSNASEQSLFANATLNGTDLEGFFLTRMTFELLELSNDEDGFRAQSLLRIYGVLDDGTADKPALPTPTYRIGATEYPVSSNLRTRVAYRC